MNLRHATLLLCLLATACGDQAAPTDVLAPDTAHGPGLLIRWAELSGKIVYATPSKIMLVNAGARTVTALYTVLPDETPNDVAISPDGKRIAYTALLTSGATRFTVIDASNGSVVFARDNQACPRWLKDGRFSYRFGDAVFLEGAQAGNLQKVPLSCATWAPDGTWYAVAAVAPATQSDAVYRVDLTNTAPRELTTSNAQGVWYDPAFSPNGQTIALLQAGTTETTNVFLMNADGSNLHQLASAFRLFGLWWSPDGKQLLGVSTASSNGSYDQAGLFLIDAQNGAVRKLVNHPVYAAAWGP